jgi:DNA ligase-1
MKLFSQLMESLEVSNKTNDKLDAIVAYLRQADDNDKLWLLALFTGRRPRRPVNTSLMRAWISEVTGLPDWLINESYSSVGDLGETIALLLPPPVNSIEKDLSRWMKELTELGGKSEDEKKAYVLNAWNGLGYRERLIFNKLIGGSFRIGVSGKLLVNAIVRYSGLEPNTVMHGIMGKWSVDDTGFNDLISGKNSNPDISKPYPFCLAYPLDREPRELGDTHDWQIEYKWDGIRGQVIRREKETFIWSRGEEIVTAQFPEIADAVNQLPDDAVIDGEILAIKEGRVLNFNELQKRLNRKNLQKKMMEEIPVGFYAYDILELNKQDLRELPLHERRGILESLLQKLPGNTIQASSIIRVDSWDELPQLREEARNINSEGLMLKHADSVYHSGRKRGDWWKWKINPLSIDAVLIYAQKGSGRRSNFYTDYTFAVRKGDELVTIAKAYSGLTDKEITEVDRFVKQNSMEKFGPVRTVKPELVFEIGFEGIGYSSRHKAGIALRFPRILRWRKDKTANEINTVEDLKTLIVS